jgi:peroxiredoxin
MTLKRQVRELFGGEKMNALAPGKMAPPISLKTIDGKAESLKEALKKGPVVAAFFKVSCPTCQFTAPFLERLHESYGGEKFTLWGISQDDAADTQEFLKEFDVDFPVLIEPPSYSTSNQFGLTHVPSIFLISPDGTIEQASVGFSKADLEKMAAAGAQANGKKATSFFKPSEMVPAVKPG